MERADIVFCSGTSLLSKIIKWHTHGVFSHCMVATGNGTEVISADAEGVVLRDMRADEKENAEVLYCPSLTREQADLVIHCADSMVGKDYDFSGLISFASDVDQNNPDHFFCSELVMACYRFAGVELLKRIQAAFVSPAALWVSPILERRF